MREGFFGGVWEMENWNMHCKHFRGSWFFLFFFLLPVWVRASQKKNVFPLSYLCGWEVDEAGQVFSLRSGKIFLLLEPALQLVNLNIMYLQRMFLNILILNFEHFYCVWKWKVCNVLIFWASWRPVKKWHLMLSKRIKLISDVVNISWNKPMWGNVACNKKLWNSCHKEFSLRCNLRYSTTNKIRNPIHTCVCYQYDIIGIQIVLIVTFCNLFALPPFHDLVSFRRKLSWFRANYHLQSKYHL